MSVLFSIAPRREFLATTLTRTFCLMATLISAAPSIHSAPDDFGDSVVYGVHHALDLGDRSERPKTDYFINLGARHGLKRGDVLEARRNTPSYDLLNRRLFKDMSFPIARMRVIHVERSMAVARLLRMLPADETPTITPRAVLIGDSVRALAASESKRELALATTRTRARKLASVGVKTTPTATPLPGSPPVEGVTLTPSAQPEPKAALAQTNTSGG